MKRLTANEQTYAKKNLVDSHGSLPLRKDDAEKQYITLSFRFFKQDTPWLGLSGKQPNWFVSLLNRLQDISTKPIEFITDTKDTKGYRFHKLKWDQKNAPMKRADFTWVAHKYLNNPKEFEFMQFEISTGTGRVIGFFDETDCFNVVAIDPFHNIQPSKIHNWQTRKTHILESEYELLLSRIARKSLLSKELENESKDLLSFDDFEYFCMDKELYEFYESKVKDGTIRSRFEDFVLGLL